MPSAYLHITHIKLAKLIKLTTIFEWKSWALAAVSIQLGPPMRVFYDMNWDQSDLVSARTSVWGVIV